MKILVVAPSWVGDAVMAHSLYRIIKELYYVEIDILAPAWSSEIHSRMPEISELLINPFGHGDVRIGDRYNFASSLRGYSRAIVLPLSLKSALIPFFSKIPIRTGLLGEFRYGLLNDIHKVEKSYSMTERYVSLSTTVDDVDKLWNLLESCKANGNGMSLPFGSLYMELISYFPPRLECFRDDDLMKRLDLESDERVIIFCPGAEFGESKRWPAEYFGVLARMLSDCQIWVLGSAKDKILGDRICELSPGNTLNLCGRTSLSEAVDLLSLGMVVVSNDSGLMHVAAAVGVPVVGIYGSTPWYFTPPLSERAKVIRLDLACSPCRRRVCRYGDYECLRGVRPNLVYESLSTFLE